MTSVIIINDTDDAESNIIGDYSNYFDDVHIIGAQFENVVNKLNNFFNESESDYIAIVFVNEYIATDMYALYSYLSTHDYDYVIGNRIHAPKYENLSSLYKWYNKILSKRASKKYKHYIPDLLSYSYVLKKDFYKQLKLTKYLQTDCIKLSTNCAYIDVLYNPQKTIYNTNINGYITSLFLQI